jgi:hypothetical protein
MSILAVVGALALCMPSSAVAQDDMDDEDSQAGFGVGGGVRQLHAKRGKRLEFVFGFGYDDLSTTTGYYLESGGQFDQPGRVDYTEFNNLHWYTVDATLVGYLQLHKIVAIRYGAGLGLAWVRGKVRRTDAICTSERLQHDCSTDPNGAQQRDPVDIPPIMPVLNGLVGVQFRPIKAVAINIDAGLRTVPYFGASAMLYLW